MYYLLATNSAGGHPQRSRMLTLGTAMLQCAVQEPTEFRGNVQVSPRKEPILPLSHTKMRSSWLKA